MIPDTTRPSIRDCVRNEILAVAAEQGKTLPHLGDDVPLLDSGLDSLCLAILVARLEDQLGFDPFSADGPVTFPITIGDFIGAYDRAPA